MPLGLVVKRPRPIVEELLPRGAEADELNARAHWDSCEQHHERVGRMLDPRAAHRAAPIDDKGELSSSVHGRVLASANGRDSRQPRYQRYHAAEVAVVITVGSGSSGGARWKGKRHRPLDPRR